MSYTYEPIDRASYFKNPRLGVVKFGSEVIVDANGSVNYSLLNRKLGEVAGLYQNDIRIAIVTSGAIPSGVRQGTSARDLTTRQKKVAATRGQPGLMELYERILQGYRLHRGQVLVKSKDFEDLEEVSELRETLYDSFDDNTIPIINANDALSKREIEMYDNDTIAAKTAVAIGADFLVIYIAGKRNGGDVEHFYNMDPDHPDARPIRAVYEITDEIRSFAVEKPGGIITRGGYRSKNEAGEIAMRAGIPLVVANVKYPVDAILGGEDVGTIYVPQGKKLVIPETDHETAFRLMQQLFVEVNSRT